MASHSVVSQGASNTGTGRVQIQHQIFNNYNHAARGQLSLIEELSFDQLRYRERAIDDAQEGTCEWVLKTAQYTQWAVCPTKEWHHTFLWIKGNPGAGKSTIMKFMVDRSSVCESNGLILPHFFNARGTEIERSAEGMYRTLLVRLLQRLPQQVVDGLQRNYGMNKNGKWPVPELVRMLKSAVDKLPSDQPATFYIDALDECDEDGVRAMLQAFRSLTKKTWAMGQRIRVCFASRPYPNVNFQDALFLDLGQQREHIKDIVKYIDNELNIGTVRAATQLRLSLCEKAGGSFMWTKLVVDILNKEYDRGSSRNLEARLSEVPSDLHKLYQYILGRYQENRAAMLICFRWLLFAYDTMSSERLWVAIQRGLGRETEEIVHDVQTLPRDTWERYVVEISKGFVQVRAANCQFIHQSVRDFLLQEVNIYGFSRVKEFEAESHDLLKTWCAAELQAFRPALEQIVRDRSSYSYSIPLSNGLLSKYSTQFTGYALVFAMEHARSAHFFGIDQTAFVNDLPSQIGPHFMSPDFAERGSVIILHDLLTFLVDCSGPGLIRETQLEPARDARQAREAFGLVKNGLSSFSPLWHALIHLKEDAILALMSVHRDLEYWHPEGEEMLSDLTNAWREYGLYWCLPGERQDEFLEIGRYNPSLALYFLLVLTPSFALEPFVGDLKLHINPKRPRQVDFLRAILFFAQQQLSSIALDFAQPQTLDAISRHRQLFDPNGRVYQLYSQILEEIRRRSVRSTLLQPVVRES